MSRTAQKANLQTALDRISISLTNCETRSADLLANAGDLCSRTLDSAGRTDRETYEFRSLTRLTLLSYTRAAVKYAEQDQIGPANRTVEKALHVMGKYGFTPLTEADSNEINLLFKTAADVKSAAMKLATNDLSASLR